MVPEEMSKYRLCEIVDGGHFFVHDASGGELARIEAKLKELKDKVPAAVEFILGSGRNGWAQSMLQYVLARKCTVSDWDFLGTDHRRRSHVVQMAMREIFVGSGGRKHSPRRVHL